MANRKANINIDELYSIRQQRDYQRIINVQLWTKITKMGCSNSSPKVCNYSCEMLFGLARGCARALPSFGRLGRRGGFCFLFSRLSCPIVQADISLGVDYR